MHVNAAKIFRTVWKTGARIFITGATPAAAGVQDIVPGTAAQEPS